jgi:DNA-binding response OmpR family regulator
MIQHDRSNGEMRFRIREERRPDAARRGWARGAKVQDARPLELVQPAAAHLLIAEDDRDMRRLLVQSFREEGYRVSEVDDGEKLRRALVALGHGRRDAAPDILVSDVFLPGFTGLELLADLRKSDWAFPVVLITAFGDETLHSEGKRLGAAMVLDKPFDIDELVVAVRSLVPPG